MERLYRGIIVGQSLCFSNSDKINEDARNNSQIRSVMVDFVDENKLKLMDVNDLFEIPGSILGLPTLGCYSVLTYNNQQNNQKFAEIEPLTFQVLI